MVERKNEYSFNTTLVERERYVKELWTTYRQIIDSIKHTSWARFLEESFKPTMVPIQRVVRAPIFKTYRYTPPNNKIHYFVTDKNFEKVEKSYLLTLPKTLY